MASKFAIISGASSGIGAELAKLAAADGYDLLVVADTLFADASAGLASFGVAVDTLEVDLSTVQGVDQLLDRANGRQVDLLCANAGHGLGHAFLDQQLSDWRHVIDTNITGTIYLLHKVLGQMVARDAGKILVTGSIAGLIPGSFNAVYNGTKAFIDNFTEALRNELKDHKGVTLTTLMPGVTDTKFFDRAGLGADTAVGADDNKADPAKVAKDGWDALLAGKGHIVSGFSNKLQVAAAGIIPQSMLAEQHRKMAEPDTAQ
ncbi:SDR family NAD(P)-dependent oxidoreductase [Sphingobium yanoikuyae]|uniref:SDR family NAD(P)-dependent oxidoreductase n=1 Tax=Sphingobium yanoikuyae TaxID=13690 RepID=UPI002898FF56|nr:SDR family NAD(P)-dependent oxidoreductase [Sphingobium yanoikuyae]